MAKQLLEQDLKDVVESLSDTITGKGLTDRPMFEDICIRVGIETAAAKNFLKVAIANAMLMDRKQRDYGPGNIAAFGTFGVTVRMNDKMERLKTLFNKGRRKRAINESIQDTFRDISNYAIIALMLELDMWPNE